MIYRVINNYMTDTEQGLRFDLHGVKGGIVERKLFDNASQQLADIWGIHSLKDLRNVDKLTLPDKAFEYTQQQYQKSIQDGKERSSSIRWDRGAVIDDEHTGSSSLHDMLDKGAMSGFELSVESTLGFAYRRLFAKSQPINFHLHPDYSDQFSKEVKKHSIHTMAGKSFEIPLSSYINYYRFMSSIFSSSDLGMLLESNRYNNSLLLMTPQRYLYISPTEMRMNYGIKGYKESKTYDKELDKVFATGLLFYYKLKPDDILPKEIKGKKVKRYQKIYLEAERNLKDLKSEQDLFDFRDRALSDFCKINNLVGFVSKSRDSRELQRI